MRNGGGGGGGGEQTLDLSLYSQILARGHAARVAALVVSFGPSAVDS